VQLLHKVYFLQGVSVQKFIANLFEQIDSGHQTHLYMINANFQEALGELLKSALPRLSRNQVLQNMNVTFDAHK
jgi:hypothetical protein